MQENNTSCKEQPEQFLVCEPKCIQFTYKQQKSTYQSSLMLRNTSDTKTVYFKFCTTFGFLINLYERDSTSNKIGPKKCLHIPISLKIQNQVDEQYERINLHYSSSIASSSICNLQNVKDNFVIKLKTKFPPDVSLSAQYKQTINMLLQPDCQAICEEAKQFCRKGNLEKAYNLYQESFLMHRMINESVYGMAKCALLMYQFTNALKLIQTAEILQQCNSNVNNVDNGNGDKLNPNYKKIPFTKQRRQSAQGTSYKLNIHDFEWLKIKIIFEIVNSTIMNSRDLLSQFEKYLLYKYPKLQVDFCQYYQKEKETQLYQQIHEFLKSRVAKAAEQKKQKVRSQFFSRVFDRYKQSDGTLRKIAKDQNQLKKLMQPYLQKSFIQQSIEPLQQQITQQHKKSSQEPPDYILDPITYEIINNPIITPNGHTYDSKSLLKYLGKHGNIDLFSKKQLRYEWTRKNISLENYIKQNQKLQKWKQYQRSLMN